MNVETSESCLDLSDNQEGQGFLQVPNQLDPIIYSNRSATVCDQAPTSVDGLEKSASGLFRNTRATPGSSQGRSSAMATRARDKIYYQIAPESSLATEIEHNDPAIVTFR